MADTTTSASPAPSRSHRFPLWIILLGGGLLVMLILVILEGPLKIPVVARPAYRAFKDWRAEQFAGQAEEFIRQQKWQEAFAKAQSANQLAPKNVRAQRLMATLLSQFGVESGVLYWDQVLESGGATPQDAEEALQLALRMNRRDLAAKYVETLQARPPVAPRGLLLLSQYSALIGDATNAVRHARAAVELEPGNPTNTFALGSLLLNASLERYRREGVALLLGLGRTNNPLQLRAIQQLAVRTDPTRDDREQCLELLAALPERDLDTELLKREFEIQLDPTRRLQLAEETIEKYGKGKLEEVGMVATWLLRQGFYARVLDLVQPEEALQNDALFRARYEALAGLERWEDAYRWLLDDKARGETFQLEMARLRAAQKLARDEAVRDHWGRLLKTAGQDARLLRLVAELAEREKNREVAVEAYKTLSGVTFDQSHAYRNLVRLLDADGDTWNAREFARKLQTLEKEDQNIAMQITYYDLLLGEDTDRSLARAQALVNASPTNFLSRIVLALAHLRNNDPAAAKQAVSGATVDWARIPPGAQAVIVATLGANQQDEAAARLLQRLPLNILKVEERELIKPYLDLPPPPNPELLRALPQETPPGN
jgi:Sec-independent protein translocase protein TatA